MSAEQATNIIDEGIRGQGGAGVAPPASPGLLTVNDLGARSSNDAEESASAISSNRSGPESPTIAGAAYIEPTVALDLLNVLQTHTAQALACVICRRQS